MLPKIPLSSSGTVRQRASSADPILKFKPDEIAYWGSCDGDASEVVTDGNRLRLALSEVLKFYSALPMFCCWFRQNASFVALTEPGDKFQVLDLTG